MKQAFTWLSALIVTLSVGAAHHLDTSMGFELDDTLFLKSVRGWTRQEEDSYRICSEIGGPNVGYFYKENGQLVCTNKRGYKLNNQP